MGERGGLVFLHDSAGGNNEQSGTIFYRAILEGVRTRPFDLTKNIRTKNSERNL